MYRMKLYIAYVILYFTIYRTKIKKEISLQEL